jgi:hypothetical protein
VTVFFQKDGMQMFTTNRAYVYGNLSGVSYVTNILNSTSVDSSGTAPAISNLALIANATDVQCQITLTDDSAFVNLNYVFASNISGVVHSSSGSVQISNSSYGSPVVLSTLPFVMGSGASCAVAISDGSNCVNGSVGINGGVSITAPSCPSPTNLGNNVISDWSYIFFALVASMLAAGYVSRYTMEGAGFAGFIIFLAFTFMNPGAVIYLSTFPVYMWMIASASAVGLAIGMILMKGF